jgi:hypothetical protein
MEEKKVEIEIVGSGTYYSKIIFDRVSGWLKKLLETPDFINSEHGIVLLSGLLNHV